MKTALSCETIKDLDGGRAELIINSAINRAVTDLEDRGDDEQSRKVVITLHMKRLDNGQLLTSVEASATLPKYKTHSTFSNMKIKDGRVIAEFQKDAPHNPDQQTMEFDDDLDGVEK